jgi:hypothetical protein
MVRTGVDNYLHASDQNREHHTTAQRKARVANLGSIHCSYH